MKTVETLSIIEAKTKAYAVAREVLAVRVSELESEVKSVQRRRMPGLKSAAAAAKDAQHALAAAVQAAPECFVQPRTITLHGIRVGFYKGTGKLDWESDERVVALIKKHLPDQAELLIRTKETPIAKALQNLSVADLRRIGCTVEEAGDSVYIKASDSDLEKIVAGILAEGAIQDEVKA
jgi:hypothetical protein